MVDTADAEGTYQIAAAQAEATQLAGVAAGSGSTGQQQFDAVYASAKVGWLTALKPSYVIYAQAIANFESLWKPYKLIGYTGTSPGADHDYAIAIAQEEVNRADRNADAQTYPIVEQGYTLGRTAAHTSNQGTLDVGAAKAERDYELAIARADKQRLIDVFNEQGGASGSSLSTWDASQSQAEKDHRAKTADATLQQTTGVEDAKLQFQKNEDAARKSYTLGLATGAHAQDKALAGIERSADRAEADDQFALDWAYAQAVQDQWSQEAFLNSPDNVAIAQANVAWWSAQESASVSAEQAIDSAYHLPWTAFLAAQAAAHQSWFNNSGKSAYLQWTNDRLSDQHTWSSNVRQAQYQELATQRTGQRTEAKSVADSTRDEKVTVADARYTYIADSNSGIATPAKDYLDNLAQAERDRAIALAKASHDLTINQDDDNFPGDPDEQYDQDVQNAEDNYDQARQSAESSYTTAQSGAAATLLSAQTSADTTATADEAFAIKSNTQTYANASYNFEAADAKEYVGLIVALAGHDNGYFLGKTASLVSMASAFSAPGSGTASPWATFFASSMSAYDAWAQGSGSATGVADAQETESIAEARANAGLDASGATTGGGELGDAIAFRDDEDSQANDDYNQSITSPSDPDDPPDQSFPQLEAVTIGVGDYAPSSAYYVYGSCGTTVQDTCSGGYYSTGYAGSSLGSIYAYPSINSAASQAQSIGNFPGLAILVELYTTMPPNAAGLVAAGSGDAPIPVLSSRAANAFLYAGYPGGRIGNRSAAPIADPGAPVNDLTDAFKDAPDDDEDLAPPPSANAIQFVSFQFQPSSTDLAHDGIKLPKAGEKPKPPQIEFIADRARLDDLPAMIDPRTRKPLEFPVDVTGTRWGDNDLARKAAIDNLGDGVMDRVKRLGPGRWHHAAFDPATGKMTMRFVPADPHKVPHAGGFDDYVKWVAGLGSDEATLRNLSEQQLKAINNLVNNHRDQLLNKLGKNEKALNKFIKAADNAYEWRQAFELANAGKAVAQQADGAIAKSAKVATSSGRIKGGVIRKAARSGAVALEALPVISIVIAGTGSAIAAHQAGADIRAILKAASFEAMNEFTGANDIKFVLEVVITGSELIYKKLVLDATEPHIKVIQNQFMNDRADKEDQIFNSLVDLMVSKINETVGRE